LHGRWCRCAAGRAHSSSAFSLLQSGSEDEDGGNGADTPQAYAHVRNGPQYEEAHYRSPDGGEHRNFRARGDGELLAAMRADAGAAGFGGTHDGGREKADGFGAVGAVHAHGYLVAK
jgi:hypothetical protein